MNSANLPIAKKKKPEPPPDRDFKPIQTRPEPGNATWQWQATHSATQLAAQTKICPTTSVPAAHESEGLLAVAPHADPPASDTSAHPRRGRRAWAGPWQRGRPRSLLPSRHHDIGRPLRGRGGYLSGRVATEFSPLLL
jgi:hypothetical protein